MNRKWMVGVLAIALGVLSNGQLDAQDKGDAGHENSRSDDHDAPHHAKIKSFSVEQVDETLTYPSYLVDIPDEHTTLLPQWSWANPWPEHGPVNYLLFASSAVTGASGGAVVLETPDLKNFTAATAEGYAEQVMTSPVALNSLRSRIRPGIRRELWGARVRRAGSNSSSGKSNHDLRGRESLPEWSA